MEGRLPRAPRHPMQLLIGFIEPAASHGRRLVAVHQTTHEMYRATRCVRIHHTPCNNGLPGVPCESWHVAPQGPPDAAAVCRQESGSCAGCIEGVSRAMKSTSTVQWRSTRMRTRAGVLERCGSFRDCGSSGADQGRSELGRALCSAVSGTLPSRLRLGGGSLSARRVAGRCRFREWTRSCVLASNGGRSRPTERRRCRWARLCLWQAAQQLAPACPEPGQPTGPAAGASGALGGTPGGPGWTIRGALAGGLGAPPPAAPESATAGRAVGPMMAQSALNLNPRPVAAGPLFLLRVASLNAWASPGALGGSKHRADYAAGASPPAVMGCFKLRARRWRHARAPTPRSHRPNPLQSAVGIAVTYLAAAIGLVPGSDYAAPGPDYAVTP